MADGTETSGSKEPQVLDEQGILLFYLEKLTKGRSETGIKETIKADDVSSATSNYKTSLNSTVYDNLPNTCLKDS